MNSDHQCEPFPGAGDTACPSPAALLSYADGKLRRHRTAEVRQHLESCNGCDDLTSLIGSPAVPPVPADLPAAVRKEDQDLVARRLGFGAPTPLAQRLLALADGLWQVRTPILVPVSVTAMLLFLLLPASRTVVQQQPAPLVYHFTEISHLVSTDQTLRSFAGEGTEYRATAGSLIFLQHRSSRPELAAGDPVSLIVRGGPGTDRVLLARASENGLIEVPLVISRPGRYQIRISHEESGSILATLSCTITAPSSGTH